MKVKNAIYNAKTQTEEIVEKELSDLELETILKEQEENNKAIRIMKIRQELMSLSQDFIQHNLGAIFEDIDERKNKFISLHNELRLLLGKNPREYITNNKLEEEK